MTVGQLKQALQIAPDDWLVIVDRDINLDETPLVVCGRRMLRAYPESEADLQKLVETEPVLVL